MVEIPRRSREFHPSKTYKSQ